MRTYPGVQIGVFKDSEEREQIKVLDNMMRHVSAALAKSIFPGQMPAANPTPVPPNPGGGGTTLPAPARGDLLFAPTAGTWSRLTVGASGTALLSNGQVPVWSSLTGLLGDYLYLPGKATTQTLLQLTTETPFTIKSSVASTNPSPGTGTYLFRGISSDSVEVFSFGVDGATTINVPSTTYSVGGNPIALTLQMLDDIIGGSVFFRLRTGAVPTNVFAVTYHGATSIDMTADVTALTVDAVLGATSNFALFSKNGITQSFIDQNGAWNGTIIGGFGATFHDHLLTIVDGAGTTRVLAFNLNNHTAGSTLTLDYRSLVTRSLIWNLSGGTGGNLQFDWAGTSGSTVTLPTATTYTLAALQIASQTWTGAHNISPTANVTPLILNLPSGATANTASFSKNSVTQSFIDTNGAWNGPIVGSSSYASTFIDSTFSITDETITSKILKFQLATAQPSTTMTVDYRTTLSRSLIWQMQGTAGSNLTFFWPGISSSRTVTIPDATFTFAGTNITTLQTWTGRHLFQSLSTSTTVEINPINDDVTGLAVYGPELAFGNTPLFTVWSGGGPSTGGTLGFAVYNNSPTVGCFNFALWPSGVGTGFNLSLAPDFLTANRTATFPNASGLVVLTSVFDAASRTTDVSPVTIIPVGVSGTYLVNWYAVVETTGSAGSFVTLTVAFRDSGDVNRTETATLDLAEADKRTTAAFTINSSGAVAATYSLTFTTTGGTPAFDSHLAVTRVG